MKILRSLSVCALMLSATTIHADTMREVELAPIQHAQASLVIIGSDGSETTYTPAMIEQFQTYSMTTTTPWRDEPANFEGALLSDILASHGLENVSSIVVTAENDFTTTLSQDLLDTVDILVATRVNGKPHSRRERGPIQFVIDSETFSASNLTSESNLVWMAARIEAEG